VVEEKLAALGMPGTRQARRGVQLVNLQQAASTGPLTQPNSLTLFE